MHINSTKTGRTHSARSEVMGANDATALLLIKGLNFLIARADGAQLKPAAAILQAARDDLAGWAADLPYLPEAGPEDFVYRQLFDSGLFPAAELMLRIRAIPDHRVRAAIADLLGLDS